VASTRGASSDSSSSPRWRLTRNEEPSSAWAAVAPSSTSTRGRTTASSAFSHGEQAWTCSAFGFLCRRTSPRRWNLKCLTTLVT
jgi:hypothetical protein